MEKKGKGERRKETRRDDPLLLLSLRLHNPDFDPPRSAVVLVSGSACFEENHFPSHRSYVYTYTYTYTYIYIYNIPRPLIEHTCIRARKIYTRRARAQTRVTARSLARSLGWLGWLAVESGGARAPILPSSSCSSWFLSSLRGNRQIIGASLALPSLRRVRRDTPEEGRGGREG